MHANGRVVPFHSVFELVTRLDPQRLADLSRNGCLPLGRYCGMEHRSPYLVRIPYLSIVPYFAPAGKATCLFAAREHETRMEARGCREIHVTSLRWIAE